MSVTRYEDPDLKGRNAKEVSAPLITVDGRELEV